MLRLKLKFKLHRYACLRKVTDFTTAIVTTWRPVKVFYENKRLNKGSNLISAKKFEDLLKDSEAYYDRDL